MFCVPPAVLRRLLRRCFACCLPFRCARSAIPPLAPAVCGTACENNTSLRSPAAAQRAASPRLRPTEVPPRDRCLAGSWVARAVAAAAAASAAAALLAAAAAATAAALAASEAEAAGGWAVAGRVKEAWKVEATGAVVPLAAAGWEAAARNRRGRGSLRIASCSFCKDLRK